MRTAAEGFFLHVISRRPAEHVAVPGAGARRCPGPPRVSRPGAGGLKPGWPGRREGRLGGSPPPGPRAGVTWCHLASPEDGTLVQLVLRASAPDYVTWARACVQLPSRSQHWVKVESRGPESASASAAPLAAGRFQLRLARGEALRGDRSAPASQSEGRRAGAARRSSAQNGNEVRLSQEALRSRSTSSHTAPARL